MKKVAALALALVTLFSLAIAAAATSYTAAVEARTSAAPTTEAVIDVDVLWGDTMTPYWHFRVEKWNSETHDYDITPGYWDGNLETYVTVRNHSNLGIRAVLTASYASGEVFYSASSTNHMRFLVGESKDAMTTQTAVGREMLLPSAVGTPVSDPPQKTLYIALDKTNSVFGQDYTNVFDACDLKMTICAYGTVAD